jgi:hypothetical protein
MLVGLNLFGQRINYNDSLVTIKGKVVDTTKTMGFYNVIVLNKSTGKGVFGEHNGSFSYTVKKGDTIAVSVSGYKTIYFSYKDSAYHKEYQPRFILGELSYMGAEVIVRPLKTLEELKEERAAIEKRPVPEVTVSSAFASPITALYVAFSKREKTKRLVAELEYKDKQDDIVKEILRIYVHNDIFDLSDDDFQEFIRFLNIDPEFLKVATDYELVIYIQNKFNQFQQIKEGY